MNFRITLLLLPVWFFLGPFGSLSTGVAQTPTVNQPSESELSESGDGLPASDRLLQTLQLTSKAFRSAANQIGPSLVTIESFGGVRAVQGRIGGIRKQGEGNTTGVMISSDGYVVTSTFNFIQKPPVITVITSDGKQRVAKLVGRDDTRKLCILKINNVREMPVAKFVDPKTLAIGQWAVSVGVGYGDTNPAISMGIISATNRIGGRAVQTDANISPANYGGPLVDIQGRVIGICVPMNPKSQAAAAGVDWYDSGIGFAIPLFGREAWLESLKRGENIYPAFVGVEAIPSKKKNGIIVNAVLPKSPAAIANLKRGDRITKMDGVEVDDMMEFKQLLNQFQAGQEVEFVVVTDPDLDLSDDELVRRNKTLEEIAAEGPVERTVVLKLQRPQSKNNELEFAEPPRTR